MARIECVTVEPHETETRRRAILDAHAAALAAVDARGATRRALQGSAGGRSPTTVIAIGKAAAPMAAGAVDALGDAVIGGIAVDTEGGDPIGPIRRMAGNHPAPGADSLEAGAAVASAAETATGAVLFLVSGGASALVELPVEGVTIDELAATTDLLMAHGVDIHRLNEVRTALSRLKGGGLRRLVDAESTVTLLVSDVVGDDPATIGSGPTVRPRTSGSTGARAAIESADLCERLPDSVRRHLDATGSGVSDWPYQDRVQVTVNGAMAAAAAARALRAVGAVHLVPTPITGEAVDAATAFAEGDVIRVGHGETTVRPGAASGIGGRNQHAALAAALRIAGTGHVFAALSTDGIDGSSHAAGAIVDGGTVDRCRAAGVDPERHLAAFESTGALAAAGDLVVTGPTGTNVGDVWIWWP